MTNLSSSKILSLDVSKLEPALMAIGSQIRALRTNRSKEISKSREVLAEGLISLGNTAVSVLFFTQVVSSQQFNLWVGVIAVLAAIVLYGFAVTIIAERKS